MKKLQNAADTYVDDMLEGLVAAVPALARVPGTNVIVRRELKSKVGIVSGGGSGHEPAHAGFVGTGMLDSAVAGEVFTSPTPDQVLAAIRAVNTGKGVLLVVKNYTGDVLNFEMAAELAQAEGIEVERVIVNDDVAVDGSTYTVGRRGIAGTVFVHKIAGAAAEAGQSLPDVLRIAEKTINQVRSMGMALAPYAKKVTMQRNLSKTLSFHRFWVQLLCIVSDDRYEIYLKYLSGGITCEKTDAA